MSHATMKALEYLGSDGQVAARLSQPVTTALNWRGDAIREDTPERKPKHIRELTDDECIQLMEDYDCDIQDGVMLKIY